MDPSLSALNQIVGCDGYVTDRSTGKDVLTFLYFDGDGVGGGGGDEERGEGEEGEEGEHFE